MTQFDESVSFYLAAFSHLPIRSLRQRVELALMREPNARKSIEFEAANVARRLVEHVLPQPTVGIKIPR